LFLWGLWQRKRGHGVPVISHRSILPGPCPLPLHLPLPGSNLQGYNDHNYFWKLKNNFIKFVATVRESQPVSIRVYSLAGQVVAQTQAFIRPGKQSFSLSVSKPGVYLVIMTGGETMVSCKAICYETNEPVNRITCACSPDQSAKEPALKEALVYSLQYTTGDILFYRCRGGIHTTIVTDVPSVSKNYTVNFVPCIDPAGKSYAIVKIGNQTWMAENLAYLPKVSKSDTGSETMKYCYVYGYEDTVVAAAKTTLNYKTYGVLYNWPAAMNTSGKSRPIRGVMQGICTVGWHLPGDDEWKALEMSLGMTQADADTIDIRYSGSAGEKLKSTWDWTSDSLSSNYSGFTALPGGYRNMDNGFRELGNYALFWSASVLDTLGYYRGLEFNDDGVFRYRTLKSHGMSVRCVKD